MYMTPECSQTQPYTGKHKIASCFLTGPSLLPVQMSHLCFLETPHTPFFHG